MTFRTIQSAHTTPPAQHLLGNAVCDWQEVTSGQDGATAQAWFQQALGVRCSLVRQQPGSRHPIGHAAGLLTNSPSHQATPQYIGMPGTAAKQYQPKRCNAKSSLAMSVRT